MEGVSTNRQAAMASASRRTNVSDDSKSVSRNESSSRGNSPDSCKGSQDSQPRLVSNNTPLKLPEICSEPKQPASGNSRPEKVSKSYQHRSNSRSGDGNQA